MRGRMGTMPPVLLVLAGSCVGLQGVLTLLPGVRQSAYIYGAFYPEAFRAALANPLGDPLALAGLVTHAFLHGGWLHVLFNCLLLLHLGGIVAQRLGPLRMVVLFAGAAAGGAAAHALLFGPQYGALIGASGAVFGIAAARADTIAALRGLTGRRRWRFLALQMWGWMLVNALIFAMVLLFALREGGAGALVAWKAHLGGYAAGALLSLWLAPGMPFQRAAHAPGANGLGRPWHRR